jgi:uncharacterized protein (TIGR03437 family)
LHSGSITNAYWAATVGFVMRNNVMAHNVYGMSGNGVGNSTIEMYFPGAEIRRNVMAGAEASRYPADNFYPAVLDDVKFVDRAASNYSLAIDSPYKLLATDGKDVGCDFNALNAALTNTQPSPTPTPNPTPTPTPTPTPSPSPAPSSVSLPLVTSALSLSKTLAAATTNTEAQIAPLVSGIEQAYAAFQKETAVFGSSANQIDTGLRAALYFSRAVMALAAKEPSSTGVQNRLQITSYRLEQVKSLMAPESAQTASLTSAHATSLSATPVIGNADTRSGASLAPLVAPASLGVILGDPAQSPLSVRTISATPSADGSLPYQLEGVSVSFGGQAAPLLSVSPSRITFLVPASYTRRDAEVIVTLEEGYVSLGTASVMPVAPALFTANGTGAGAALAMNAGNYQPGAFDVTTPQNLSPDKRTRIVLYGTGISSGTTNASTANDVRNGNAVIVNLCESVLVEARTSSGSVYQLPVEFAGRPGPLAGLDQLNIVLVPELKGAGTVELTLIAGDQRSNIVTISVK